MKFLVETSGGKSIEYYNGLVNNKIIRSVRIVTDRYDNKVCLPTTWESIGFNHHQDKEGHCIRNREIDAYEIELNSLEELVDFMDNCGEELVLFRSHYIDGNGLKLEIYDDYRE